MKKTVHLLIPFLALLIFVSSCKQLPIHAGFSSFEVNPVSTQPELESETDENHDLNQEEEQVFDKPETVSPSPSVYEGGNKYSSTWTKADIDNLDNHSQVIYDYNLKKYVERYGSFSTRVCIRIHKGGSYYSRVKNAEIYITGLNITVICDDYGKAILINAPAGYYSFYLMSPECKTAEYLRHPIFDGGTTLLMLNMSTTEEIVKDYMPKWDYQNTD